MSRETISIIQILLSALLIVLILIQAKGTGLGSAFGGDLGFYHTRRGVEKLLFQLTMVIAALFLIISILGLLI